MNMRVVRIITGMSLLTLFFVMGCRDVFEKDISEKEVVLVARRIAWKQLVPR